MDGARPELWNAIDNNFQGPWFEDILGSPFRADILWIANAGISAGCGQELFCPKDPVTREQMASFLARALNLPGATRTTSPMTTRARTRATSTVSPRPESRPAAARAASALRQRDPRADGKLPCPRAEPSGRAARDYFTDDNSSAHEGDINRLARAGITSGCSATTFCPRSVVVREQMAAFLHRAPEVLIRTGPIGPPAIER